MLFVNSTKIARKKKSDGNISTHGQGKLSERQYKMGITLTLKLYMDGIVLSVCTSSMRNSSMSCKPTGGKLTKEVPDRSLKDEGLCKSKM